MTLIMPQLKTNVSDSRPNPVVGCCSSQPSSLGQDPSSGGRVKVMAIYGVPASGKSFLLNKLKHELGEKQFSFFEGSEMIASLVPGGLLAFQEMDEKSKTHWRQLAVDTIRDRCTASGKSAVVTGHLMFWPEGEERQMVYTSNDLVTYTHIIYLDTPAAAVEQRQRDNPKRTRLSATTAHLAKWQQAEKAQLRILCRNNGILFLPLVLDPFLLTRAASLLRDFHVNTEAYNSSHAETRLDEILAPHSDRWQTVLVLDADRTLAAEDTGALFWTDVCESQRWAGGEDAPLRSLFGSPLGYSYDAFRQAALLYEEVADKEEHETICERIASRVAMYPEFVSFLRQVELTEHVGVVVVSCGLRRVWEMVLDREGLSGTVNVIAGGRIDDNMVVTPAVKATIVVRLRNVHQKYVWAFGDSPLDLEMLKQADRAVVMVGDKGSRSKSMDDALSLAITQGGLKAHQVLLPSSASPRLDTATLPLIQLTDIGSILSRLNRPTGFSIRLADHKNAAKLLATPMRDSATAGPTLRAAHRRAGAYLATEFLTSTIGVEECPIAHVLGHATTGYRLLHEQQTTIVALMRAGEPMASGVNDVFPLAVFVHANAPENIKLHHLEGQLQVLLVDSVVNTGKTILEFVEAIRKLDHHIRIVVVAGVVQAQCTVPTGSFYKTLTSDANISLVGLRRSDTKFTGSGSTDTGNRLFNTTHLP